MEQGPVLQARGRALAPVAGIAGQSRVAVRLKGSQVRGPSHLDGDECLLKWNAAERTCQTAVMLSLHAMISCLPGCRDRLALFKNLMVQV